MDKIIQRKGGIMDDLRKWFDDFLKDCIYGQYGCADSCDGGKECKEKLEQIRQIIKDWYAYVERVKEAKEKLTRIGLELSARAGNLTGIERLVRDLIKELDLR